MNRRDFLVSAGCFSIAAATVSCASLQTGRKRSERIAFNTANLVGRVTGYRYSLQNWGEQHQRTIRETDAAAWRAICADISKAGYGAVEIWEAHAAPESLDATKAKTWKSILDDYGLKPVAYAGGLRPETCRVCQWLGIPHIDGGIRGLKPDDATVLCRQFGIRFNTENHPERTVAQILEPIGGGNEWLGVCVDTGWLGTQGASAPDVIRALGPRVRHCHVKDVRKAGAHETCPLGSGIVNIPKTLEALAEVEYGGWYSWEDEPEDRNPMDIASWTLSYLRRELA